MFKSRWLINVREKYAFLLLYMCIVLWEGGKGSEREMGSERVRAQKKKMKKNEKKMRKKREKEEGRGEK